MYVVQLKSSYAKPQGKTYFKNKVANVGKFMNNSGNLVHDWQRCKHSCHEEL